MTTKTTSMMALAALTPIKATTAKSSPPKPAAPPRADTRPTLAGEYAAIAELLSYRRPHESAGEEEFNKRFIESLPGCEAIIDVQTETDKETNTITEYHVIQAYFVTIPRPDGKRLTTAFCAHTDSVHNRTIPDIRQRIAFDPMVDEFYMPDDAKHPHDCLGADDAGGVYVLRRMIEANVPGLYVFFRGEERGGIGSDYVMNHRPEIFEGIEHAIQFDRHGTTSIITEMACGRTCSDEFAVALGTLLGMGHKPDPTGSFTDTATLAEIVPECTNVSIGYSSEHSHHETLDADYLVKLAAACIDAFRTCPELPTRRKPGEFHVGGRRGFGKYGGDAYGWDTRSYYRTAPLEDAPLPYYVTDDERADAQYRAEFEEAFPYGVTGYDLPDMDYDELDYVVSNMSFDELVELLKDAGNVIADQQRELHGTRKRR